MEQTPAGPLRRFRMLELERPDGDGILSVDVDRLDEFDQVPLPGPGGVM
jgi:hypothetical protein